MAARQLTKSRAAGDTIAERGAASDERLDSLWQGALRRKRLLEPTRVRTSPAILEARAIAGDISAIDVERVERPRLRATRGTIPLQRRPTQNARQREDRLRGQLSQDSAPPPLVVRKMFCIHR